jgi:NAD(P)-dependent dehydrogenase (short-subunit alcohol dehydrogenase family)
MLDLELDKAHVLVSGANGGIGLVTVKTFLGESHISLTLTCLKAY